MRFYLIIAAVVAMLVSTVDASGTKKTECEKCNSKFESCVRVSSQIF